jgi:hypothetical protein
MTIHQAALASPSADALRPADSARLSAAFARALGRTADEAASVALQPAGLLGVEHEFTVHDVAGARLDFRSLIHRLPIAGARLDPGDPNAYRCSWGGVFTADGHEAELATPPIRQRPHHHQLHLLSSPIHCSFMLILPPGF